MLILVIAILQADSLKKSKILVYYRFMHFKWENKTKLGKVGERQRILIKYKIFGGKRNQYLFALYNPISMSKVYSSS